MSKHVYDVVHECDDHSLTVRVAVEPNVDKQAERDAAHDEAFRMLNDVWQVGNHEAARFVRIEWKGVEL